MIHLITDSAADLPLELQQRYDITVLPLTVQFGEQTFLDGVDISAETFYARLATAKELPTTSQPSPDAFLEIFRPRIARGDSVVGLFLSSALSGTYQSACIARDMLLSQQVSGADRLYLVDSRSVTLGLSLLLLEGARLRDEGISAAELAAHLETLAGRVRLLAVLDTLKYLKMGGRISATTAFVGGVLGINPLIEVTDGRIASAGKARGRQAACAWMAERLAQEPPAAGTPLVFGHASAPKSAAELQAALAEFVCAEDSVTVSIGSVVGTHTGPGAAGVAYLAAP